MGRGLSVRESQFTTVPRSFKDSLSSGGSCQVCPPAPFEAAQGAERCCRESGLWVRPASLALGPRFPFRHGPGLRSSHPDGATPPRAAVLLRAGWGLSLPRTPRVEARGLLGFPPSLASSPRCPSASPPSGLCGPAHSSTLPTSQSGGWDARKCPGAGLVPPLWGQADMFWERLGQRNALL